MPKGDIPVLRMSASLLATFDAVISDPARSFLESLSELDRGEFFRVLDSLLSNPHPDGVSKVLLDFFPYPPETFGFTGGEFWITYKFINAAVIGIAGVHWKPDSPRRGDELHEI